MCGGLLSNLEVYNCCQREWYFFCLLFIYYCILILFVLLLLTDDVRRPPLELRCLQLLPTNVNGMFFCLLFYLFYFDFFNVVVVNRWCACGDLLSKWDVYNCCQQHEWYVFLFGYLLILFCF